jgi:predicted aspartyl protease
MRYRYNQQVVPPAAYVHVIVGRSDANGTGGPVAALVDSGADKTVIPRAIVEELALPQAGAIEVAGLNQIISIMPLYIVNIAIGNLPPVVADVIGSAGEQYVLLGRDVLNRYRVTLDGPDLLCTIEIP